MNGSRLRDTPINSRPRERLISANAKILSTKELFTVILGSGTRGMPVERVASQVATLFETRQVGNITVTDLLNIRGIGNSKACALLAMLELADRLKTRQELMFRSPTVVWTFLQRYAESQKEQLICLYLNARYQLVHQEVLAVGALNQLVISPRDVFSPIKNYPIASIILAHNHPSGDPTPSEDDVAFTKRIKDSADLLGIELVDHIVIAKTSWASMKEKGELV